MQITDHKTARTVVRILKVARTIPDLEGAEYLEPSSRDIFGLFQLAQDLMPHLERRNPAESSCAAVLSISGTGCNDERLNDNFFQ